MKIEKELCGSVDRSRWNELFGTPERAAKTAWRLLMCDITMTCGECPMRDGCNISTNADCDDGEAAMLEWLKGDAERMSTSQNAGKESTMKPSEFWNDSRTEREFEECGLQCCTRTIDLGHRCGYVALPKGHPLFGKGWDACYDIAPELDVDGGITFAEGTDDAWILGWDAAHAWHRRDWSIASDALRKKAEERPELYMDFDWPGSSYMVDADMAERETRNLARQLAKLCEKGEPTMHG